MSEDKSVTLEELFRKYAMNMKPTARGYVNVERQHYPQHQKPPKEKK